MKKTLFLAALLAFGVYNASASVTYTGDDLLESFRDGDNNIYYDGSGYFAVASQANTQVSLTLNLDSLNSYVNANDYTGSSYLLLWENSIQNYGIGDYADIKVSSPNRTPSLTGYVGGAWKPADENITYSELQEYADENNNVTLTITNSPDTGVKVTATNTGGTSTLYERTDLRYGSMKAVTGYHVNMNYVTGVTFHTESTLDVTTYLAKEDYSERFVSSRTGSATLGADSIGRVTFLGDSITHGVDDQSYRWQLFKILTDNGIENEIVGPREGYNSSKADGIGETRDAGSNYGGADFANVHLAQASGRTRNIISGRADNGGVNYGGHSTASTAESFDSNTWICMMGTNDLLSDGGTSTANYSTKMQNMLGGTVAYDSATNSYNWTAGESWGNMGTIVNDVCSDGDTFYMLSITPWATHSNNQHDDNRLAGLEFNRNLEAWTQAYSKASGHNIVYVDVTRGMVDVTSSNIFRGHDAFFNRPGTQAYPTNDGLHPNEQGALLMAGNLAQAMGIGGRTAGLTRAENGTQGTTWFTGSVGTLSAGNTVSLAKNAFSKTNGYTIDFSANFGDGAMGEWLDSTNALSITLGDGTQSGTLNVSEGYIMWGSDVLFCRDNSTLADDGNLRIAWHNGNTDDNVLSGYYVWLGDMLIGQALSADSSTLNGITFTAVGADALVGDLTWANTAYAPTTSFTTNNNYAYHGTQAVDFSNAQSVSYQANGIISMNHAGKDTFKHTGTISSFLGLTRSTTKANYSLQEAGTVPTIFGTMEHGGSIGNAGILTVEVVEGAKLSGGTFGSVSGVSIVGAYQKGTADEFNVIVKGGTVGGANSIVGGVINGAGKIGNVNIDIKGGSIAGSVYGGSFGSGAASATVGHAAITVSGGTIGGSIVAGGTHGSIGSVDITISGGVIKGDITEGVETKSTVTIKGSAAEIGKADATTGTYRYGSITADHVILQKVAPSDTQHGMDKYEGTISAKKITLDTINTGIRAQVDKSQLEEINVINSSYTSLVLGDAITLNTLKLESNTVFSAYKESGVTTNTSAQETTITVENLTAYKGATLNANLHFTAESTLTLTGGALAMGSDVDLATGMWLTLSEEMLNTLYGGYVVELFTGVDALSLDGKALVDGSLIEATRIFNGLNKDYTYTMSHTSGVVALTMNIPEPTTATLSLLALAALAARRRRK